MARTEWYGGANYYLVDTNDANDSFDPTRFFVDAPALPLSASDQIAAFAAKKMAAGNTQQANILFALARFLKSFGS
jgi:hypothetical protein